MSAASPVDVDHLRRTLQELGYKEPVTNDSAPLIHHVLTDLKQSTEQYTDLLRHYDDLFARWQLSQTGSTGGRFGDLELTHLTGLDSSMLGIGQVDESFMLNAVEQARTRIDTLTAEVQNLQAENRKLQMERENMSGELQKTQITAQELSQLLHTKHGHLDTLQAELDTLRKKTTSGFGIQLNSAVKTAIAMLPTDLQPAYNAKVSDSIEGQASLMMEILQRVGRESAAQAAALKEAKKLAETLKIEQEASEQAMSRMTVGVSQYQAQIAELNARLHQQSFERSLHTDIASQIEALEGVNQMMKEKVAMLERLKHDGVSGNGEMANMTVNALLESLSAELNTEVCFSTHLNQLVEKLNKRRIEQDKELSAFTERIRDSDLRISKLEGEKAELRSRLERATNDLLRKDNSSSTNNEVIFNLQQALEVKTAKIDEQKKYCGELKTALDQCQLSMANMRRNEEMIRNHVMAQDEEIRSLRVKYEQVAGDNSKVVQKITEMTSELTMMKSAFSDKTAECQRIEAELKAAIVVKEKASMDVKNLKSHIVELEEAILAKRKEKDLLMTTYCRVIKDNEKLHADMQKLHDDYVSSRTGDVQSEQAMKAFQTKITIQAQELERMRTQISEADRKIIELESRLDETQKGRRRLDDDTRDKDREIASLKSVISSLERSKKDIAAQMARFGQQASELRTCLRRIEEERNDLQNKLKSSALDSPMARNMQTQLATVSMELDQARTQLRLMEREKEMLSQQVQLEKLRSIKLEEMLTQERNKASDSDNLVNVTKSACLLIHL